MKEECKMFKNVGNVIRLVGIICFFLFPIGGFLIGGLNAGTDAALLFLLVGLVASFIIALPLVGFGKLINDVEAIKNK